MLPRPSPLRISLRRLQRLRLRPQSQSQLRCSSSEPPNAHRAFYRDFGPPVLKVFLGALVTYQALYWGWLKLESVEMQADKSGELERLEKEVRDKVGK